MTSAQCFALFRPCALFPKTNTAHPCSPRAPQLFRSFSPQSIASASLGQVRGGLGWGGEGLTLGDYQDSPGHRSQVYKATTHEGLELAVKVQRPGALRQCLLDGSVRPAGIVRDSGSVGANVYLRIRGRCGTWGSRDQGKVWDSSQV